MGEWLIYGSNGVAKATVKKLEYNGEFMGETIVTCDVYSPSPISFSVGDYLSYRGENFVIDYDATRKKQSRVNTYGNGFVYEGMKFTSYVGELKKCDFLDFVLNDNLQHYSQLPTFDFYAETVEALADRLQANLNRMYTGSNAWTVSVVSGFEGKENVNVQISNIKCFDALKMAYEQFNAQYVIRGRNIYIGTAGSSLETTFRYGLGNGLKTIERSVDENDSLVTRLRAYGNTTNLPSNYYANKGRGCYAPIFEVYALYDSGADIHFKPKFANNWFTEKSGASGINYWVSVSLDKKLWVEGVASPNVTVSSVDFSVVSVMAGGNNTTDMYNAFKAQLQNATQNTKLYFSKGVNYTNWKSDWKETDEYMPNMMSIDRLMIPSFPEESTDPYIDSANISSIGIREKSVYFDGSEDELPDIHPSMEGMTAAELRAAGYTIDLDTGDNGNLDEIAADATELDGSTITTNGTFVEVNEVPGFKVTLKDIGFDINSYLSGDTATLSMKSGMCGGRDFTIVKVTKLGNKYVLECQRVGDANYYFPYNPYNIKKGDKFVLTNIEMPQAYIDAASQRLLVAAQEYLAKHSVPQWVYSIKMDDVWMQRQRDDSESESESYYWNIKEGDVMSVQDSDLDINVSEVIDKLTIREGYSPIPEFEVVLRKEKPQGTIGVLQNRIKNLERQNQQQTNTIVRQQDYISLIIGDRLNTIQEQLDHVQVTYFGDYVPTLSNEPASTWQSSEYSEHDGDMFYNRTTGKGYEFTYQNGTWGWIEIQDEDIRQALEDAAAAQDTADGKRRVFVTPAGTLPTPPYDENDLWVNATYPSDSTLTDESQHKYYNDILKCITPRAEGATASINDWSLGSKYTDDSSLNAFLNGYTGTLTGIRNDITNAATAASNAQTSANNASSAAAQAKAAADALDYLKQAYLADNTLIDHGLILSTIVALRDSNNNVWSGISGAYDSTKLGNGMAAWYGGGMIDGEVSQVANAAKSLFRFDGSGYVASGNLKWDANGNVTIQGYSINASTLQVGGANVATQAMLDNFVSKAFFNRLFTAYDANGTAIVPNDTTTAINNLKIMVGAWTEQYLSALGLNSEGGGGGGTGSVNSIKVATNTYLDPDEDGIIDMSSYAANWNDAYNKRHTHSNKSVLDEITSTKVSNWDAVYGVVPSAAYESGNQLADKNFVNSSISTATATYISNNGVPFNSLAELQAYTGQHDKNDYAFVKTTDSAGNTLYNRYKFDGTSWSLEYTLNNSSFTADQWSAINSGITSSLVSKLNGIAAGAQVNVLESVKINGTALSISSKAVNIVTGNGLQSSSNTISVLLPSNSGLSVASTGLKLDIVNNLTTSSDYKAISATQAKKIWDLLNQMFTLEGAGTTASPYVIKANYGLYTEQFLSALGQNSQGGSGGGDFDEEQMWAALQSTSGTYATTKIATSHIPDMASTYGYLKSSALNGYATQSWVNQQGFLTTHQSIYALTLKAGGTAVTTFTPNSADASLDFVAGTNISLTRGTNQITIANTYSYTLPLAASGTRGGVQIGYSETNSGTSTTRNYAVKLSSEKMYVNVPWTDTIYKLTLNGTTNGASGGTSLGSFYAPTASGTANQVLISGGSNTAPSWTAQSNLSVGTAAKLNTGTTTYSAWGQTYWSSGVPQSISGNMTSVGSITPSANGNALGTTSARFNIYGTSGNFSGNVSIGGTLGVTCAATLSSTFSVAGGITLTTTKRIYFGDTDHYLELDSTGFHFSHGVYSDLFISALGANSSGGGSGTFDEEAMWEALGTTITAKKISNNYLNLASWAKASSKPSYTFSEIGSKPTTLSGYGITDAYTKTQVDNALSGYLPLSGGTLTGAGLTIATGADNKLIINNTDTETKYSLISFRQNGTEYGSLGTLGTDNLTWKGNILLHAANYNSYAPSLTGTGASGTWGISVSGNSASTTALKNLYNSSTRPTSANLEHITNGGVQHFKATSATTTGKPVSDAHILHFHWDTSAAYDAQMAITTTDTPTVQYRTNMSNNGWGSWITALTSSNYSNYALPLSGGTISTNSAYPLIIADSRSSSTLFVATGYMKGSTTMGYLGFSSQDIPVYVSSNAGNSYPLLHSNNYSSYALSLSGGTMSNTNLVTNLNADLLDGQHASYFASAASLSNYVTLTTNQTIGGTKTFTNSVTISSAADNKIIIDNTDADEKFSKISFRQNGTEYGILSTRSDNNLVWTGNILLHAGNYSSYALPLSGGTMTGNITMGKNAIVFNITHDASWNVDRGAGLRILNTVGESADGALGSYAVALSVAGYYRFQIAANASNSTDFRMRLGSENWYRLFNSGNSNLSTVNWACNNLTAAGDVIASSDIRKKNIISNTKFNVKDIASARSILYEWKDRKDKIHGGSIAQDWLGKADSFLSQDNDGFYSINYGALALCSAITIAREVVKHDDEITRLKKEVVKLRERVAELEERRIA